MGGSSSGSMIYMREIYGYGISYGVLYFSRLVGLAPKKVVDVGINGTNLSDIRNGTDCIQYDTNAGKMPGFNWIKFHYDTHFHNLGRLGRIVPMMIDLGVTIGFGLDENTTLFMDN